MQFVRYARNRKEQNLEIVQYQGDIFFQAVRDIKNNEELLVWYSDSYDLKFGVPSVSTLDQGKDLITEVSNNFIFPQYHIRN